MSACGKNFNPADSNCYTKSDASRMSMMKYQFEDLGVVFCDEISMVGSMKLAKINFRLQDIAEGSQKNQFMGGISFVASGKQIYIYILKILHLLQIFRGSVAITTHI